MILVTAFTDSWHGTGCGVAGALCDCGRLSTPLLLSTGENHEVTLLSYLLLMAVAVLVLVILRPWSRLLLRLLPAPC